MRLPVLRLWRRLGDRRALTMIFRLALGLLFAAAAICFALYFGTRQVVRRKRGVLLLRWTVMAGLGFFALLILERVVMIL